MSNNNHIEEQFKDAFAHFEADVNPQVWNNIAQQLPSISVPSANPASITKGILGSSKIATWSLGLAATIIVAVVATNYLTTEPKSNVPLVNSINTTKIDAATIAPSDNGKDIVANDILVKENTEQPESKIVSEKKSVVTVEKVVPVVTNLNNTVINNTVKTVAEQPVEEKVAEVAVVKNPDHKNSADHIPSISSADEKHENISPPAIDTTSTSALKSVNEKEFDWGVIPNAFSPNADGKNDVFKITNPNIETIKVTIMDRSGKQVHEWNGINGFWDGKDINGNDLPKGVYYYFIFATSVNQVPIKTKGTITLLR